MPGRNQDSQVIAQDTREEGSGNETAVDALEGSPSRQAFLHLFWSGGFGLFLLLQGYALWAGHNPPMRLAFNGVFLACALVVLALLQRGHLRLVTLLTGYVPPALLLLVILMARSIHIPAVVALPPMVVVTAWLLGRRAAVWLTAAAVLEVLGVGLYLHLGGQPRLPPPEPFQYGITLLVYLLVSLSIGLLSESSHREQMRIAQDHARVDKLTGLATRNLFLEQVGQALRDSERRHRHGARQWAGAGIVKKGVLPRHARIVAGTEGPELAARPALFRVMARHAFAPHWRSHTPGRVMSTPPADCKEHFMSATPSTSFA